jgi:hypothetical protein
MFELFLSPLIGLLGSAFTAYQKYQTEKLRLEEKAQERTHQLAMLKAQTEAMQAEVAANIQITQTIAAGAVDLEEARSFTASLSGADTREVDKGVIESMLGKGGFIGVCGALLTIGLGFTDFIKALIRPLATIYMTGLATWVTWKAWETLTLAGGVMSAERALETWEEAARLVMILTATLLTWWFGDRRLSKTLTDTIKKR